MKDEAFAEICHALEATSSLQHLNLNINVVHNSYRTKELSRALRVNGTVTHLMYVKPYNLAVTRRQICKLLGYMEQISI